MAKVRLDDDVLDAARSALAELRDTSTDRIDRRLESLLTDAKVHPDVTLTAYWVGDIARVDVKASRR
jgi:hypothetical protein